MKRSILFGSLLGIVLAWVFLTPAGVSADAGWSCPAGTTLSWTDNDIPDETFSFTVPNSPWNLIAAKAGTGHQVFGDGTVGLNNQTFTITGRNAISHIDYCKVTTVTPTTTEVPPSSTTTTTTNPHHYDHDIAPDHLVYGRHLDVSPCDVRRLFPRARLRLHRRRAPRPHPYRPQLLHRRRLQPRRRPCRRRLPRRLQRRQPQPPCRRMRRRPPTAPNHNHDVAVCATGPCRGS